VAASLFITKPLKEAEERHSAAFLTAVTTSIRGHGRASQARVDDLYNKLYPPTLLFEDPYTHEGVLWTWGIDWAVHVSPLLTGPLGDRMLEMPALRWLYSKLNLRRKLPSAKALSAWDASLVTEDPKGSQDFMKLWHKYYKERRKAFKKFIDWALQLESSVECNLNL